MNFIKRLFKKEAPKTKTKKTDVFFINDGDRLIGQEYRDCVIVVNGNLAKMNVHIYACIFDNVIFLETIGGARITRADNLTEFLYRRT